MPSARSLLLGIALAAVVCITPLLWLAPSQVKAPPPQSTSSDEAWSGDGSRAVPQHSTTLHPSGLPHQRGWENFPYEQCDAWNTIMCQPCGKATMFQPCFGGCLCPGGPCIVLGGTFCAKNPYWVAQNNTGDRLYCNWARDEGDALPELALDAAKKERELTAFQSDTRWMFPRWKRWGGKCAAQADVAHGGAMRGYHSATRAHSYVLENVCVKPIGPLQGYDPQTQEYLGVTEVFDAPSQIPHAGEGPKASKQYLENVSPLSTVPSCFLDTPVIMIHVEDLQNLHGHMHFRAMPIVEARRQFFSNVSEQDVLVIIAAHRTRETPLPFGFPYAFGMYHHYPIFFDTWASVIGLGQPSQSEADGFARMGRVFRLGPGADQRAVQPLCFRRIVSTSPAFFNHTSQQFFTHWGLYRAGGDSGREPHQLELAKWYRSRVASCVGVSQRVANVTSPRVVISLRTRTRRFVAIAYETKAIVTQLISLGAASVTFLDYGSLRVRDMLATFLDTDVLLGFFGSNMWYLYLMPTGGGVGELWANSGCCAHLKTTGFFADKPNICEYSSGTNMLGIHLLSVEIPSTSWANVESVKAGGVGAYVPAGVFAKMLEMILCRMRHSDDKSKCEPYGPALFPFRPYNRLLDTKY